MSATPAAVAPFRTLRRVLEQLERALRPADTPLDEPAAPDTPAVPASDDLDSTTTRELLIPVVPGEPDAARASRQAQAYLERRRRKLSQQLERR